MPRSRPSRAQAVVGCLALLLCFAGCAAAPPGRPPADPAADAEQVARLERNDLAALATMLSDDLVYCHSTGRCETRAEFLEALRNGAMLYRRIAVRALQTRAIGDAVLVHGRIDLEAEMQGAPARLQLLYTDVYVRRDGRWQLVAWQSTRAPDGPTPP